jgi:outer membrane protein assembly factor BamB
VAGGGLFLPLDSGRAVLVDYRTGAVNAAPFQPDSDPVGKVKWTNPLTLPDDPDQVVLADSRKKLYRLRVGEQVRGLQEQDLETEMLGEVAGVQDTIIGTTAGPAADFLIGFEMATLERTFKLLLNGRVTWGPVAAGDVCLIQTDDGMLRGFGADGKQRFESDLPEGEPVGKPLLDGSSIILTGAEGWIVVLDANSGQIVGQTDLGQPLSATPLQVGPRLLVPGSEGLIYITEVPAN